MMAWHFCLLLASVALGRFGVESATGVILNRIAPSLTAVKDFSWENCDGETLPDKIQSLTILPDPLIIPGEITVCTILNTTVTLTSPVKIQVTVEKDIMGEWLKIPCFDDVGSCTYDNICDILDQLFPPGQQCPPPLYTYGIPCRCPFQAGSYYLPVTSFFIPNLPLPYWLTKGNYCVKFVLSHKDQEIGCAKITFSLAVSYSHWL